jgi:predicted transcriptional regulator of viral defense system
MSTLLKSKSIRFLAAKEELRRRRVAIFTVEEFVRIFHASSMEAKYFLETYAKKGFLTRLKKGLYAVSDNLPGEKMIANALMRPSYISFESALSYHGLIPETVYEVISATTKAARMFSAGNLNYSYMKVKKEAFAGYRLEKGMGGESFLIADPEKSAVDYLYLVSLGRKNLNDRLNISKLDKKKMTAYAKLYKRDGLIKIIKKL